MRIRYIIIGIIILICINSVYALNTSKGLILSYNFEQNLNDSVSGNNLVIIGNPVYANYTSYFVTSGNYNINMSPTGNTYLLVNFSNNTLTGRPNMSMCASFRYKAVVAYNEPILLIGNNSNYVFLGIGNTGAFSWYTSTGSTNINSCGGIPVSTTRGYTACSTTNSSGTTKLYINSGANNATVSACGGTYTSQYYSLSDINSSKIALNYYPTTGYTCNYGNMYIDNVQVFNRELTTYEIDSYLKYRDVFYYTINSTSPANNTYTYNTTLNYTFNVIGLTGTHNMNLYFNNVSVGNLSNINTTGLYGIVPTGLNTFTDYLWQFNSTDITDITNYNKSESRNLYIVGNSLPSTDCSININGDYIIPDTCGDGA